MSKNNDMLSFKEIKSTITNFSSIYCDKTPLSSETLKEIPYELNKNYISEETEEKLKNYNLITENVMNKATTNRTEQEVINHNINSYVNGNDPIRLSDAIAKDSQKGIIIYLERALDSISKASLESANSSYIECRDILTHRNNEEYQELSEEQQDFISDIYLQIANNLIGYRQEAKKLIMEKQKN